MKKYHEIAVGWIKQGTKGEFVSASANGKNSKVKLFVELEGGETLPVNSFAMFQNERKEKETHPDVKFVFTTES